MAGVPGLNSRYCLLLLWFLVHMEVGHNPSPPQMGGITPPPGVIILPDGGIKPPLLECLT